MIFNLVVVGGGAAGFMGAIKAAEDGLTSILLLESTPNTLEKVRISGGGRCNVTNACWDPKDLVVNYPRGKIPLFAPFTRFAAGDAVAWFADRGLELKVEDDGRIFPVSNSSLDVVRCLRETAVSLGVVCETKKPVQTINYVEEKGFLVNARGRKPVWSKKILLATGGYPSGRRLASNLGHQIVEPVPSLFSLRFNSSLVSCSGIAIDNVELKLLIGDKIFQEIGRVLITHWGLSGPAILKLTAFAARELYFCRYKCRLNINWANLTIDQLQLLFRTFRYKFPRSTLRAANPCDNIPLRFWNTLLTEGDINSSLRWSEITSSIENRLIKALFSSEYLIANRGPYGDEFVTAGGVELSEVDFSRMESKICPGLFFAGEVLNVDGITGGFNFQHCWSSGWLAGRSIAEKSKT